MKQNINIWILIIYSAIVMFVTGIVGPILPLFLNDIGFPVAELGTVIAVSGFTSAILSIFFGNLSERYDRRTLFLISGLALAVLPIGYMFAESMSAFLIIRVLEGIAAPLAGVTSSAILLDLASASGNKGVVFGKARTIRSTLFILGPTAGGIFVSFLPIRNIFLMNGVLLLGSTLLVVTFLQKTPRVEPKDVSLFSLPVLLKNKVVLSLLGILLLDFMNFQSLLLVFPLYGEQAGLSFGAIGALITVQSLAYAALQYPIGKLTDAGKVIPILCVSAILHGPLIFLLSLFENVIGLGVIIALVGFASAPAFLAVMLLVSDVAGEETGIAMGMISSTVYLAAALGPAFTAVFASLDLQMGFIVPVIASILMIPLTITVINWHRRETDLKNEGVLGESVTVESV